MGLTFGITGASGYIGTRLCEQLAADPAVDRIVGLDLRPPPMRSSKFEFHVHDVSRPFDDLFAGVDVALHLAWVLEPTHDAARQSAVNLGGTRHFLRACERGRVRRVFATSSATAYGAWPDNPLPLPESHPVRPDQPFQYAREKAVMEGMLRLWASFRPEVEVVVARPCIVIGPHVDNYISRTFFKSVVPVVRGADPPLQFVHEDDCARAAYALARHAPAGTYNVAGDGVLRISEIVARFGGRRVSVPLRAVEAFVTAGWHLHARRLVEAPPALVPFVRFPWVVDNGLLKHTLGFTYAYDTVGALEAFRQAR